MTVSSPSLALERCELDPIGGRRTICGHGHLQRPAPDRLIERGGGNQLVDQTPLQGALALDPLLDGAEHIGAITADVPLVDQTGQATSPGQDPEERDFGQRNRRRAVVDEHDVVGGQGELVATAGGISLQGREVSLTGVGGGVLDGVPGLVGELAEVDLERVRRHGEHSDVGPGAEDAVVQRPNHHRPHLGVFEAETLHRVRQFDVHAEVVRVQLHLVPLV